MPKPWVAVVVLAYKQAAFLEACLQSLDTHGLEGVQVLLVDNGSGDGTAERMQTWASVRPDIILHLHAENLGHCQAFNQALAHVKAPYVLDLAADDTLLPGGLRRLADALDAEPRAALAHANALHVDEGGQSLGYEHPPGVTGPGWSGEVWAALFGPRFICPPTVLFRVEALREAGGYDETLSFEDFDVWMRLLRNHQAVYVPELVCAYRQHAASLSEQQLQKRDEAMLASIHRLSQKAFALARKEDERLAIGRFVRYHLRLSAYLGRTTWVQAFHHLLLHERERAPSLPFWSILSSLPLSGLYRWYTRRQRRTNRVSL